MPPPDRAQFLSKIADLDLEIGDALAAADLPELVALAGKAALICATAMLYQQPAVIVLCICCDRPATVRAADLDLCEACSAAISAPDPALDESWGEYLADVVAGLIGAAVDNRAG